MTYFKTNYPQLTYPIAENNGAGLYNAQLGAIHAIGMHFTTRDDPAVITMPTGSGKTAVLMMTPFVLRSSRVLVITPSRLVREQITEDFRSLVTLRKAGAIPSLIPSPKVFEERNRIDSVSRWEAFREFDVVVATPNCASPAYKDVPAPPSDLFDLVLIDEAHHSPAKTWHELLEAFSHLRTVLFTATPFRRDRAEIRGRFVYSYPIPLAYKDGIFGKIAYHPVTPSAPDTHDVDVANAAEAVLRIDREAGLSHYLMVRTDRLTRADELATIYRNNTSLQLRVVHSRLSNKRVKEVLDELRAGQLDGVICVDMMGEGFDFPKLKVAAIHAPHKSLEVTLQFIGRFARTNAPDIGEAKFIAVPNDIEIERQKLFAEGAVWQQIVADLSHSKIEGEIGLREVLQEFEEPDAEDDDLKDLSLYSLYPRGHVKVYDVSAEPDFDNSIELPGGMEIVYRSRNQEQAALVLVTRSRNVPKWSSGDTIVDVSYDLLTIHYDKPNRLLFINASRSVEGLYKGVADSLKAGLTPLPTSLVSRVIKDLKNQRIFNLGMRNIQATNKAESYRIVAGSDTQGSITPSDARRYRQGHVFMTGEENGNKRTLGYSSLSKVWEAGQMQIPELLDWCRALGKKIRSIGDVVTHSGLDYLSVGSIVDIIPDDIIWAYWDKDAFDYVNPVQVRYKTDDGTTHQCHILELDLAVMSQAAHGIRLAVTGDGLSYCLNFSLDDFFEAVDGNNDRVRVIKGNSEVSLIDYVNEHYIDFHTSEGALFRGNEIFKPNHAAVPIDVHQLEVWTWDGVNIEEEVTPSGIRASIHGHLRQRLETTDADTILYDHGTGEIADFVTFKGAGENVDIAFYHCKASGDDNPGARIDDLYEVCGQAQKSVGWALLAALQKRLQFRKNAEFIRGSKEELAALLERAKTMRVRFEIVIVQPGVSRKNLSRAMAETLGATNDHVVHAGCAPLRVIASA